jgi:molybdate transport system substrate-binding protein
MTPMIRWPAVLALALAGCAHRDKIPELTVSVAASLHPAIDEVCARYQPARVRLNFGASGALARQIENGAPADVIVAAGTKPVDELAQKGLLLDGERRDLLRNELVLISSNEIGCFESLLDPKLRHVSIGDPGSVPAGDYARQVLTSLKLWDRLQPKLVIAQDVRQVLSHVATGNADAGLVYATDARIEPKVRVVCAAPPGTHEPILYPVAVLRSTLNQRAARAFVAFLAGPEARAVFEKHGFRTVSP